jgi:hypothetical protein
MDVKTGWGFTVKRVDLRKQEYILEHKFADGTVRERTTILQYLLDPHRYERIDRVTNWVQSNSYI